MSCPKKGANQQTIAHEFVTCTHIVCFGNFFQGNGRSQALRGILGRRRLHEDTRTSPKPLQLLAFNANDQNAFKHAYFTYTHVYHM